jgi:oxygen-independent coproporphyrinogen-3 oxidase
VNALTTEFRNRTSQHRASFDTIYFGGGTPSAIPPEHLSHFLGEVRRAATIADCAEITAEANPSDERKFQALREAGITRLSLGIQSTNDQTLRALGRTHKGQDAAFAVEAARLAGFENVSIDMIFGAPEQTTAEWQRDLENALTLEPDHMSLYGLTIEPRTPFAKKSEAGQLVLPVEDDQAAMYDQAILITEKAGLNQYEISNFSRTGFESRHNLSCWRGDTYIGVGLSAHSYDGLKRSWNVRNLNAYLDRSEQRESTTEGSELIGPETRKIERIMLGLRTRDGIDSRLVNSDGVTSRLLSENLIQRTGERLTLTRKGKGVADSICAELVRDL